MGKIIFKVPESKHPFVGLGEGFIIAENGKVEPKITVSFPSHSIEIITLTGEQAKLIISQMNSDDVVDEDKIEYAKGIVCKILQIDSISLHKSKSNKCAFGRTLIYEYAHKKLNISFPKCAGLFIVNSNSPGGICNILTKLETRKEENMKYMPSWEQFAYLSFQEEMKNYSYIFEM